MNTLAGIVLALIGALLGVAGFSLYQVTADIIAKGERLWGAGWLFLDISYKEAHLYQSYAIGAMAVGGVLLLSGFIIILRKR